MILDLLEALDLFLAHKTAVTKERALARLRPSLQRALARAFRKQGRIFVRLLASIRDRWPIQEANRTTDDFPGWEQLWVEASYETSADMVDPLIRARTASLLMGGESLAQAMQVAMTFDLANPMAVARVRDYGATLVAGVDETTKGYIRTIISDGLENGWSYDKVARSLLDRFDEFAVGRPQKHIDSRAHGIAVTEIGEAYESGNATVADDLRQAGLAMEKSWLTVNDDHVDVAQCEGNQSQGWIPLEQAFQSGDMHPLAHPYCRCSALYRRVGAGV